MLEKKTFVDQITVDEFGTLLIRYKKAIVEDGKVTKYEYHRTSVMPGDSVDAQMDAVDNHLEAMGEARPALSERALPKAIAAIAHTPEKIAARQAREANQIR